MAVQALPRTRARTDPSEVRWSRAATDAFTVAAQDIEREGRCLRDRADVDDIHDLRVATRRARTTGTIFGDAVDAKNLRRAMRELRRLADGLGAANSRLPQIFAWSLVSATVGVLLKLLENVHEKLGEIISMVLGTAWTIMTFFVVPVLVVEKVGPFEAISRSTAILRKAWGEALVSHWGIGLRRRAVRPTVCGS